MTELVEAPQGLKTINHWIGGRRHEGRSGRSGPVFDPATGLQTAAVDFASAEEVDAAVQAAKAAFPAWRSLSLARRAELFFRIRELFAAHRDDLARLLTAEHGKVLSDGIPQQNSITSSPRVTSPVASVRTLPCSAVSSRARSSLCAATSSRMRKNSSARRASESDRQAGKASRAACTAASTSSAAAKSTDAVCRPVAGSNTGPERPERPR